MKKVTSWFKKERNTKNWKFILIIFAAFWIGCMIGVSGDTTTVVKTETKEVVKEVPKEVIKTETKEVVKEVTPQSCKDVIELDNKIFQKTGESLSDVFNTEKMDQLTVFIQDNTSTRTANIASCYSR